MQRFALKLRNTSLCPASGHVIPGQPSVITLKDDTAGPVTEEPAAKAEIKPETAGKNGKINFDFLQKLGRVLMTVIGVIPAAGLMRSIGKLTRWRHGRALARQRSIGWVIIGNLHILFAGAIGSRRREGSLPS